jgi:hypothetical protein
MAATDERSTYRVERRITIGAPPDRVFAEINDFHRWREWSPWEGLDPDLQRDYSGPAAGVGAAYAWSGNRKAGKGRMEIVESSAPGRVGIQLDFLKPFKAHNQVEFRLSGDATTTDVTWSMTGAKTLGTKIMGIFTSMDKLVGKDFEKGLAQLKAVSER